MKRVLRVTKALVIGSLAVLIAVQGSIIAASFIGDAFPIIADATLQEVTPSIAYNSVRQEYLVVWSNDRPGNDDIRGQRLTKNGTLLGGPFWISAGSGNERWFPDVAYNSQHDQYLVVWQYYDPTAGSGIKGRFVNGNGVMSASEFTIRDAGATAWAEYEPAVAYASTSDKYLVVYEQVWAGNFFICGRVVYTDGTMDSEFTIVEDETVPYYDEFYEPDLAYNHNANRYLVVWQHEFSSTDWDIHGQQVTGDGALWGGQIGNIANTGINETSPSVAANPNSPTEDKFLVAYEYEASSTDHQILASLLQENGTPDAVGIGIATYGSRDETAPAISSDIVNGKYFVVWRYEHDGSFAPIRGQALTYWGALTGTLAQALPTNSDGDYPAVAAGPVGDFMVTWQDPRGAATFDIYGRLVGNRSYIPLIRH